MFRPCVDKGVKNLIAVLPGASTVTGFVSSSDVGKLVQASSNCGVLLLGSTADLTTQSILGIIAAVPTATTPASTVPFYIEPIQRGQLYEGDFSTTYSTALPATTDIGKYIGVSNTTTVAGGSYLSMAGIGNAAGTTSGDFFRISGMDLTRRVLFGTFNSSHLAI